MATVTGLTASRTLGIENGTVASAAVDGNGDLIFTRHDSSTFNAGSVIGPSGDSAYQAWLDEGNAGTVDDFLNDLADRGNAILGFVPKVQSTPPASPTEGGLPVLWFDDNAVLTPVPVNPTSPSFNGLDFEVTVPSLVGVKYQVQDPVLTTWFDVPDGVTDLSGYARPCIINVRAVALPGYVLVGDYEWTTYFADASAFTLYAQDNFDGTASSAFATGTNVPGRTLDDAGNASVFPQWVNHNPGHAATGLMIDTTGLLCTYNAAHTEDPANGYAHVPVGTDDFAIEVDVSRFAPAHGRMFAVYCGAPASSVAGGVGVSIYISSTTAEVQFPLVGGVAAENLTYRTSVTEAMLLGTWRFEWANKVMAVTAPDDQIFVKDYNAAAYGFGQEAVLRIADYGATKLFVDLSSFRIYR